MADPIDKEALDALLAAHTPREAFGPDTDQPCLIINLSGTNTHHAAWLTGLPCPIIGIGNGALAEVCDVVLKDNTGLETIISNIEKAPVASMILAQHLRASETLNLHDALTAESFAYASVQQGPEFSSWLESASKKSVPAKFPEQPLLVHTNDAQIYITLNDPDTLNAMGTAMRDALCEALDMLLADANDTRINLSGAGRCFSIGGKIDEVGETPDPATAHWIRSLRLPAWRLARLQDRLDIHINGAAIGAGAEIAAFGKYVTASPDAWFQLPELKYGLIPGSGGTASLPRRIGRQRTAYMALSMKRINAQVALEWGLIDAILS